MKTRAACLGTLLLVSVADANDGERMAMARLHLSTEPATATGCARLGRVSDDSIKDLRRKILRAGGDTGILSFGVEDMSVIYAQVFRCGTRPAPPPASSAPPGVPPPPPGTPPPPPPGPVR